MDELMIDQLIDLLVTLKHLPGKHDQSDHAKGRKRRGIQGKQGRRLAGLQSGSLAGDTHQSSSQVTQRLRALNRKLNQGTIQGGNKSVTTADRKSRDIDRRVTRRSMRGETPYFHEGAMASSRKRDRAGNELRRSRLRKRDR